MKAQVIYKDGWMVLIPKSTNASVLFLEWISGFNASSNTIHHVSNYEDSFGVRLHCKKEKYIHCAEYINANL